MFSPVQRPSCFTSHLSKKKKKKIEYSTSLGCRCRMKVRWRFQNFFHDSMLEVKGDPSFSEKLVVAIVRGGVEQFVAALWNGCRLKTQTVSRKTLQLISKRNFFSTWPAVIRRFLISSLYLLSFKKLWTEIFFFRSFQNSLLIEKSSKVENKLH